MDRKEQKYQKLITLLAYYGNTERFSILKIQKILKVGFPWAQAFHDRLYQEGWIDEEGHKTDGSYPYGVCLEDLKRTKRYCGSAFPYPLPLGRKPTGERHSYSLEEIQSLLITSKEGLGKSNAVRLIITSLVLGGSLRKPGFLLIDTKRVYLEAYAPYLHLVSPILKERNDALDALRKILEEKNPRKTPLVVLIEETSDLLEGSNQALGILKELAKEGSHRNVYLIAATQRPSEELYPETLRQAFLTTMDLHYGGREATLSRQEQPTEELVVPTLSEKEAVALLKELKKKREGKKNE